MAVKSKKPAKAAKTPSFVAGAASKVVSSAKSVFGGSSSAKSGGKRRFSRKNSPTYWANKVLVAKLKRKYNKLRFAGV